MRSTSDQRNPSSSPCRIPVATAVRRSASWRCPWMAAREAADLVWCLATGTSRWRTCGAAGQCGCIARHQSVPHGPRESRPEHGTHVVDGPRATAPRRCVGAWISTSLGRDLREPDTTEVGDELMMDDLRVSSMRRRPHGALYGGEPVAEVHRHRVPLPRRLTPCASSRRPRVRRSWAAFRVFAYRVRRTRRPPCHPRSMVAAHRPSRRW